jgi:hypothetical protein
MLKNVSLQVQVCCERQEAPPPRTDNILIFLDTVVYAEDMQYVNYILPIINV